MAKARHSKCRGFCPLQVRVLSPPHKDMFFKKQPKIENADQIIEYVKKLESRIGDLEERLGKVQEQNRGHLQKFKIIRYNPFKEMGGDQSFSFIVLDKKNNGFIVTSIYSRDKSNTFAKPVVEGKTKYQLSDEEEDLLKEILNEK